MYGKIFKEWKQNNTDADGNVIDEEELDAQVLALRTALESMNKVDLAVVIEKLIDSEEFNPSDELQKFIDVTKRFVVAVEKEPKRIDEFTTHWLKFCGKMAEVLDEMYKNNLIDYVNEYLDTVRSELD